MPNQLRQLPDGIKQHFTQCDPYGCAKIGTEQATGKENRNRMYQRARIERLKVPTRVVVWQQFLVKEWHNIAEAIRDPSSDHSS